MKKLLSLFVFGLFLFGFVPITHASEKIIAIGGITDGNPTNDVWASLGDLKNWKLILSNTSNPGPHQMNQVGLWTASLDGKIYAETASGKEKMMWTSSDGITWNKITSNIPNGAIIFSQSFNGKLWALDWNPGETGLWSSTNGSTWSLESSTVGFAPTGYRMASSFLSFKNKAWIIGGVTSKYGTDQTVTSDVWSSLDGVNWTQVASGTPWKAKDEWGNKSVTPFVFKDALWVVDQDGNVSSSTDGVTWKAVSTIGLMNGHTWPAEGCTWVSFNNKILMFNLREVYSSTDGVHWTLQKTNLPRTPIGIQTIKDSSTNDTLSFDSVVSSQIQTNNTSLTQVETKDSAKQEKIIYQELNQETQILPGSTEETTTQGLSTQPIATQPQKISFWGKIKNFFRKIF